MTTVIALCLWSTLIGLAAWRPSLYDRQGFWVIPTGIVATLALSPFWWDVAWALFSGGDPPLAGPAAAFSCVWILVLSPILQRSLDVHGIARTLCLGLIAAAALGMALDIRGLTLARLTPDSLAGLAAAAAMLGILAILFLAGLVLCLMAMPARFPWDYPAWYVGLLLMAQAANPLPTSLDPGAGNGLWALCLAFCVGALPWLYLRRDGDLTLLSAA